MNKCEYEYLQNRLTKKTNNNPYHLTGCTNYETGYKKGVLAAKSILSDYFKHLNKEKKS